MSVAWVPEPATAPEVPPVAATIDGVIARFGSGADVPEEVAGLATLQGALRRRAAVGDIESLLRRLTHDGYLRGALVTIAESLRQNLRAELVVTLARELMDALAPDLGVALARGVLTIPAVEAGRLDNASLHIAANLLLGEGLIEAGDIHTALRHFEAVLAIDVTHRRALRGWGAASAALERRGLTVEHRSRGLALLDGLEQVELQHGLGLERYELARPLGRGRHAVVYQAYDRRVGRDVAIKRLLADDARADGLPGRVLHARFFAEARTLERVRNPYVISILDVQPRHRFIALQLCRGGNLRLAMRRGLVGRDDLDRIGAQLRQALAAVHCVGAVHRDVKPANILVREAKRDSAIALADFGLAVYAGPQGSGPNAGTLRYLAPELRTGRAHATAASDLFSAGVVLLELALSPEPLPESFDHIDAELDPASHAPTDLAGNWTATLRRLLAPDPEQRQW